MSISVKVNGIDTAKAGIKDLPANTQRETIRAMSVIAERSVESGAARHNGDGSLFHSVFSLTQQTRVTNTARLLINRNIKI